MNNMSRNVIKSTNAAVHQKEVHPGHIDFCLTGEGCAEIILGGWVLREWSVGDPHAISVQWVDRPEQKAVALFYARSDIEGGIGFLVYAPVGDLPAQPCGVSFNVDDTHCSLKVTTITRRLGVLELFPWLRELLAQDELFAPSFAAHRAAFLKRVVAAHQEVRLRAREVVAGTVDFCCYHSAAGGWLFAGWAALGEIVLKGGGAATLVTADGSHAGEAVVVTYDRSDLPAGAAGVVAYIDAVRVPLAEIVALTLATAEGLVWLRVTPETKVVRHAELDARIKPIIDGLPPTDLRDRLLATINQQPYNGADTMTNLSGHVWFEVDEAIACGEHGVLLIGWHLAQLGTLHDIRVRCGDRVVPLDLDRAIRVKRPDVIDAVGRKEGFENTACGFVVYLADVREPGQPLYIEVRTHQRKAGYRNVRISSLDGVAAIKHILGTFDVYFDELPPAIEHVVGPAVLELNTARVERFGVTRVLEYGSISARPRFTVIVPLYGRIDFAEYQMAFFSRHEVEGDVEYLYVLDEPERAVDSQRLFATIHARFGVPCRLLLLPENRGYAAANNAALLVARGRYVVFLNSDVFPGTSDWLERLAARLEADPVIGMIGPMLLFEDGSVQHRGMLFEQQAEFGNWWFCKHADKGRKLAAYPSVSVWPSITGACIMMERALAVDLGGFDCTYAIGDFEDADLCMRVTERGYDCTVDTSVVLYHLERKSQANSAITWRRNLTLCNAWIFNRRWGAAVAALSSTAVQQAAQ